MQISRIKKLLRQITSPLSLKAKRPSAETSEHREESEMQNAECRTVGASIARPNAKCRTVGAIIDRPSETEMQTETEMQNYSDEPDELSADQEEMDDPSEEALPVATNTKSHLSSSVPRAARIPSGALTKGEMAEIRQIFGNMDDAEIQRLYKRVTK